MKRKYIKCSSKAARRREAGKDIQMSWKDFNETYLRQFFRIFIFRLLPVGLILFGAWYGFLRLVNKPPLDTSSVLIMVWASVILLILAFFPKIFEKVKAIKLKDVEIELQEAVAKSAPEDYISIEASGDEPLFSEKGDLRHLQAILREATLEPDRPVLLLVNLKDDYYISIVMLFKYLFFLNLISMKTIVLFVSSEKHFDSLTDVRKDSLIGAMSGKRVLRALRSEERRVGKECG